MAKLHKNPFKFGDPVEGTYYLKHPALQKSVEQFLKNQIHVVLIGPRRFGKTSFVLNLLHDMSGQAYTCIFIDIFNITSHKDFLQQMLRSLRANRNWWEKIKDSFGLLTKLRPKISAEFDAHVGQPSLGFTLEKVLEDKDVKEAIQDLLAGLEKLGENVIVAIDEFQKIAEIDDQGWLEATLRTHMQQMKQTSFLFTGSRKSLIYDMLNNHARPLYRSCQSIEFPSFGEEFTDWVIDRFAQVNIVADRKAIHHLRGLVQDTPNYVQMICFHLVAKGVVKVGLKEVDDTLAMVVRQNSYAYQTLLNTLTLSQQRVLRLAAKEQKQIFSKELLKKYEISSGAAMASAIRALKDKGILDEEGTGRGKVIFDDPLFATWLKDIV